MKVLADYWFNDMRGGTVGFILAQDEMTGEKKVYIGTVEGHNQAVDRESILDGGQKLPLSFLEGLVKWLKPGKKGYEEGRKVGRAEGAKEMAGGINQAWEKHKDDQDPFEFGKAVLAMAIKKLEELVKQ